MFVTEADGFLGTELIKVLVTRGHEVGGLAHSPDAAERVRRAGATAVIGDLTTPGPWQDEAQAEWVFHLSTYPFDGGRLTAKRAGFLMLRQVQMDAHLLDAVAPV